jgi:hypothetical protein
MPAVMDSSLRFDPIEDAVEAFSEFSSLAICQCVACCCGFFLSLIGLLTLWYYILENGEFIVVLDSQDRENEGDLIIAADSVTDAKMAFLVRYSR